MRHRVNKAIAITLLALSKPAYLTIEKALLTIKKRAHFPNQPAKLINFAVTNLI